MERAPAPFERGGGEREGRKNKHLTLWSSNGKNDYSKNVNRKIGILRNKFVSLYRQTEKDKRIE